MQGVEGNGNYEAGAPVKNLFRIGEVSRLTSTKPFVLRYWETEFPMLQPAKSPKGHRLYRRDDIETVFTIKRLLYDEGFTIAGARRQLRDQAMGATVPYRANGAVNDANGGASDASAGADGSLTALAGEPHREEFALQTAPQTTPHTVPTDLALLNRKTLVDLRDSLRSLLTALEPE